MTTATQIIERAYGLIGFKDPGEALSGADASYALTVLNDLIDGWNTQRLYIVTIVDVATTVTGSPVTIGPSMTINVARPIKMEQGAYTRSGGVDYPLTWIERDQYAALSLKAVTSAIPEYGYYDAALPTGSIYLWPYSSTPISLHTPMQVQLTAFADLSTNYTLAPGYKRALQYSLAEELSPGLRELPVTVVKAAALARQAIKRTNTRVPVMSLGVSVPSNILVG